MATEALEGRLAERAYTFGRLAGFGVALLSLGAAAIHFAVLESHFDEWWGYGLFFAVVASLQAVWALLIARGPAPWLSWAGAAGNAAVIAIWAITRTAGIPFGPSSGEVEGAAFIDVLATGFQALIVVACLVMVSWKQAAARQLPRANLAVATVLVAAVVAALTSAAVVDWAGAGGDAHGEAAAEQTQSEHGESPLIGALVGDTEDEWGIRVTRVSLTAGGGMIDVRYEVTDPVKAAAALAGSAAGHSATPEDMAHGLWLVDEDSGYAVIEANLHQMGRLQKQRLAPQAGESDLILFANTTGIVEPGDKVSLVMGGSRLEHLEVR